MLPYPNLRQLLSVSLGELTVALEVTTNVLSALLDTRLRPLALPCIHFLWLYLFSALSSSAWGASPIMVGTQSLTANHYQASHSYLALLVLIQSRLLKGNSVLP